MVVLKIKYSKKYKNNHMRYYGEKSCSYTFRKVGKVLDEFSKYYNDFGSRHMAGYTDYIEITLQDNHLYPINNLIEKLKSIEEIGSVHIV